MFRRKEQLPTDYRAFENARLPRHVAIIMDGNGRWAIERGKMRITGHRAGMERMVHVVQVSSDIGIEVLTLYAFSTENWKRPRAEVEALFSLLVEYIRREIHALHENNVRLRILGQWHALPATAVREVERGCTLTQDNTGLTLCIALNYGGRAEILQAAQALARRVQRQEMQPEDIDEAMFSRFLYTDGLPDPDIVIRTGGDQRLSNFLLYQSAYAEFCSVPVYWPDFTDDIYARCIRAFLSRDRRFGDIGGSKV